MQAIRERSMLPRNNVGLADSVMTIRRIIRACAAVSVLTVYAAASAAEPPGHAAVLTKPVNWAARASDAQLAAVYPKDAKGVGFANIGCLLGTSGVLTQCQVVGEAPQGFGFGAAALGLTRAFKAHFAPGEEGSSVLLPLEFDPPGAKPPIDPINCLPPLCVLEIAPGKPIPAQP